MKRLTSVATAVVLALAVAALTTAVAAQGGVQERTVVTFDTPVELPGTVLPPGTYVFRMADTASRNVVQVLDEGEEDILGQWLSAQAERRDDDVTDEALVAFHDESEGATPAIQYWFLPGERVGQEFIYPEDQARTIAERTGGDVRTSAEGHRNGERAVQDRDR